MLEPSPQTSIRVIDSHTGGEPTRVVVEGMPDLGKGDMASRRTAMRESADWLRSSLVTEPRGSEWMVGAVLQQPQLSTAATGVVFFNNAGYLSQKTDVAKYYPQGQAVTTGRFAGTSIVPPPDYAALARAYGGLGERVESPREVRAALERGFDAVGQGRLALLDVVMKAV